MSGEPPSLVIDCRERRLLELLPHAQRENLALGDVQVRLGETVFVFERKTANDLESSIKDGRYREQKARVLAAVPPARVAYFIEGRVARGDKMLEGAITNMQFRDGVHVVLSANVEDTARWIDAFHRRAVESPLTYAQAPAAGSVPDAGPAWVEGARIKSCR
jgi:ERCC4-type nuclease